LGGALILLCFFIAFDYFGVNLLDVLLRAYRVHWRGETDAAAAGSAANFIASIDSETVTKTIRLLQSMLVALALFPLNVAALPFVARRIQALWRK
jgi:hypothetical protein